MPKIKHIHTYQRVRGKKDIYFCKDPECTHWRNKKLLVGKKAKCFCGEDYILDDYNLTLRTPHCPKCTMTPKNPAMIKDKPRIDPSSFGDMVGNIIDLVPAPPDLFSGKPEGENPKDANNENQSSKDHPEAG